MDTTTQEGRLLLAIQATRKTQNPNIKSIASTYNVPRTTLRRRLQGITSRRDIIPKSRKLTNLEESMIVEYVLDLDSRSFPPRLREVEDMANRLLADRDAPRVGKRWASNFVKR